MADSTKLLLPYLEAAQAQKHVTHNEALRKLDILVQMSVLDKDLTAPPGAPSDSDSYIVAAGATGAWAGHDGKIAAWQDGAWMFYTPREGWLAWVADEDRLYARNGAAWGAPFAAIQNLLMLGINTAADALNRLAVKTDGLLFSHDDVTPGTGHMRATLNKSVTARDLALILQVGFSTRALLGLLGNDDLEIKVSPDGAVFHQALAIDKDTGNVAIGTSSDANNRLLVVGESMLFTSIGSLFYKMSKGAIGNDIGLFFQTNFQNRALAGLLGSDDFELKVTPDAANFYSSFRAYPSLFGRTNVRNAARRQLSEWLPRPNSTTLDQIGLGASVLAGTATAAAVASTSMWTNAKRLLYASAGAAGSSSEVAGNDLVVWRGNSSDRGGFYLVMRGGFEVHQTNARFFMGLLGQTTAIGNINPSTLLNSIGIGYDSGQSTMRVIRNDGSGAATVIDLGVGFSVGGHELYELVIACEPGGSEIRYRVERLNGGNVASGSFNTDTPASTQFLTPHLWGNNGSTAAAVQVGLVEMYLENVSLQGSRGFELA